jgi:hypothetical protein
LKNHFHDLVQVAISTALEAENDFAGSVYPQIIAFSISPKSHLGLPQGRKSVFRARRPLENRFLDLDQVAFWFAQKNTAGSIYNCTAKDVDVTTLSQRTSTVVNGTLLEQ